MMIEYLSKKNVIKMLHDIGGCDATYASWADGWDKAVDEAIYRIEKAKADLVRSDEEQEERLCVVATDGELELAKKKFPQCKFLKTGVGAINVMLALAGVDRKTPILNYGYAGSNKLPIGTEVEVGKCCLYHPSVEYAETVFDIGGSTTCLTSSDFVTSCSIEEEVVFDMELAYILALGFTDVRSIKVVSDNLSLRQYQEMEEKQHERNSESR